MSNEFETLMTNAKGLLKAPLDFAQAVAELTEAERKSFSKPAQKQMSDSRAGEQENFGFPTIEGHTARLALLALAPKSAACRRMELNAYPRDLRSRAPFHPEPGPNAFEEAAVQILIDRKPDWANEWLELQLAEQRGPTISAPLVRKLVRAGVCSQPQSIGYARVISMLASGVDVEHDPDLIEDAWLLFQVPTGVFGFITHIKSNQAETWKEKHRDLSWPQWFYYLAHHGKIDRDRLLDELLAALWREFPGPERAGFMHFHRLLAPTDEELLARQSAYIELLRNPNPPVVTFALKILKGLSKLKQFSAEEFLRAAPVVFDISTKTQPNSALAIVKPLLKRRADLKSPALEFLLCGLSHPESDVQLAVLSLLESWRPEKLPADDLLSFRDRLAPLAQPKFEQLLAELDPAAAAGSPDAGKLARKTLDLSEVRERVAALPDHLRTAWKLEQSLAACETGNFPVPVESSVLPGLLTELPEVAPIQDVEELIDVVGRALERVESPMEIERILDGLSRLGQERPADFSARTNAIRQRLLKIADPMRSPGMLDQSSLLFARFRVSALIDLLSTWLEPDTAVPEIDEEQSPEQVRGNRESWMESVRKQLSELFERTPEHSNILNEAIAELERIGPEAFANLSGPTVPVLELLALRARLVQLQLHKRKPPQPLLALPTHEHGWIDPQVFVDRLRQLIADGLEPSRLDFLIALARLAPDHREEALQTAVELPEPYAPIVRYALGDELTPTASDRQWKQAWLAAGRARSPRGPLEELAPLELPDAANAIQPAVFQLRYDRIPEDHDQRAYHRYTATEPYLDIEPAGESTFALVDYPLLVLTQRLGPKNNYLHSFGLPGWGEDWLASHWPASADPFLAGAIQHLLLRLDQPASSWGAVAPLMTPLLHSELVWSETALRTLWLGLFSRDNDARTVASDALIEGILDGRADPEPLAGMLVEIASQKWAKLNRLAEGLRPVIRVSQWGSVVVAYLLDELIASWETPARDGHHVLEIQLELLMETGGVLSDRAAKSLRALKGSSKTARLAKQLLKLQTTDGNPKLYQALLETLEIRLSRAERSLSVG